MTEMPSAPLLSVTGTDRLCDDAVRGLGRPRRRGGWTYGVPGSALLHLAVLLALASFGSALLRDSGGGAAVETEVISSAEFDRLSGRQPPADTAPAPTEPAPVAAGEPLPATLPQPGASTGPSQPASPVERPLEDGFQHPQRMLSERALDRPGSRGVRRELARLSEDDRIAQLCDLEAMEQIAASGRSFNPDRLVDYARADTHMRGDTLIASGAAFRSHGVWQAVEFRCGLDPERRKVASFAFKVGAPIPREEWAALSLPARY